MTSPILRNTSSVGGGIRVGVPPVIDLPQADAEALLARHQLRARIQPVEAEGTPGHVFAQQPPPRTVRPRGSVVTLQVIRAPAVPHDIGTLLADLQAAVAKLETDEAAERRKKEIIDGLGGSPGGTSDASKKS